MPIHQVSKFQSRPITNRGLTSRTNGSTTVLRARWSNSREDIRSRTSPSYPSGMPPQLIRCSVIINGLKFVRWFIQLQSLIQEKCNRLYIKICWTKNTLFTHGGLCTNCSYLNYLIQFIFMSNIRSYFLFYTERYRTYSSYI